MRLYGRKFEIVSEPVVIARNLVTVDAKLERVRIPLPVLKTAGMFTAA